MARGLGSVQRKILLLLFGGLSLGLSGDPKRYFRILRGMTKEWQAINRHSLRESIKNLYRSRLVEMREAADNTVTLVLTKLGKKRAEELSYNLDTMTVPIPRQWDRRWRLVIFDIPHYMKRERDAFRGHLRRLGFHRLQKSVFIFPHPCGKEIDFLAEFHGIRPYVREIEAVALDNELHLREIFRPLLKVQGYHGAR